MTGCLNLSTGRFNNIAWLGTAGLTRGAVSITRTQSRITIQRDGNRLDLNGLYNFAVYGTGDFVALARKDFSGYTLFVVDITDPTALRIQEILGSADDTFPPKIESSPGSGSLLYCSGTGPQANQISNPRVVRSDNGTPLLTAATGIITLNTGRNNWAEVTNTHVEIYLDNALQGNPITPIPIALPQGRLTLSPSPAVFPDAVLGADDSSLATQEITVTLSNTGNDCVEISGIGNDGAFSFVNTPGLFPLCMRPNTTQAITLRFAPGGAGQQSGSLPITKTTGAGPTAIAVSGTARNAISEISVAPAAVDFGTRPAPVNETQTVIVRNSGERAVFVSTNTSTVPQITWTGLNNQRLTPGASTDVLVRFSAAARLQRVQTSLDVSAPGADPRRVPVSGAACQPVGQLVVPPSATLAFGTLQDGFRTVKRLTLRNTGNGDAPFEARITNASAGAAWGLQKIGDDILNVPNQLSDSVLPVRRCGPGPTGSGDLDLGIVLFAGTASAASRVTADLEIEDRTTGTVSTFALEATIVPAVPVDAVLCFDVSGSMADAITGVTKIQAARSAADMFGQMMRVGSSDQIAMVTYGTNPDVPFPLAPAAGNRGRFRSAISGLNPGGRTNIAGGMIRAEEQLAASTRTGTNPVNKVFILLTDGFENTAFQRGGTGDWFSITGGTANSGMARPDGTPQSTVQYQPPSDVKIHAVGLGTSVDRTALNTIAASGSGLYSINDLQGQDFFALEKHFTQIFMDAVGSATIVDPHFTIQPGDTHVMEFDVLRGDLNTMVVMYDRNGARLPFVVISPQGEVFDGRRVPTGFATRASSSATTRFLEITFPKSDPARSAGRWRVEVHHPGKVCFGDIAQAAAMAPHSSEKDDKADTAPETLEINEADLAELMTIERIEDLAVKLKELGQIDAELRRDILEARVGKFAQENTTTSQGFIPEKCVEMKDPVEYGIAIGAASNLRMQAFVDPAPKVIGDPLRLDAEIAEAGLPVTGAQVQVEVLSPSGTRTMVTLTEGASLPDGSYGGVFSATRQAGVYKLTFRATGSRRGESWAREAQRTAIIGRPDAQEDCCDRMLELLSKVVGQTRDCD